MGEIRRVDESRQCVPDWKRPIYYFGGRGWMKVWDLMDGPSEFLLLVCQSEDKQVEVIYRALFTERSKAIVRRPDGSAFKAEARDGINISVSDVMRAVDNDLRKNGFHYQRQFTKHDPA